MNWNERRAFMSDLEGHLKGLNMVQRNGEVLNVLGNKEFRQKIGKCGAKRLFHVKPKSHVFRAFRQCIQN